MPKYHVGPDRYLDLLHKGKQSVSIPVIGSLNGSSPGGWVRYAEYMEEAGADALELNIFDIPTDPSVTAEQLETRYCDLVRAIRKSVRIPIAVKLGPYFTSFANFAKRLAEAGADGIVIFNRFYQPDFDLEEMEVTPNLVLSSPHELRLRLHWAAILYHQVETYIAITGGVHDASDVLKCMMAGAHVAMMTSALLKYGIEHIGVVLAGMEAWMTEHEYVSDQADARQHEHGQRREPDGVPARQLPEDAGLVYLARRRRCADHVLANPTGPSLGTGQKPLSVTRITSRVVQSKRDQELSLQGNGAAFCVPAQ